MSKFAHILKKYLDIFDSQERYFVSDIRNLELFAETPLNTNLDEVRIKVSAINDMDVIDSTVSDDLVNHIVALNIDDRLKKGDLTVVEEIANLKARNKNYHFLHFASAYCNYHRPDVFPIYSEQYLEFYKVYVVEQKLGLDPDKLTSYLVFSQALNHLVDQLGLKGRMDYLHFRKFAWLYAETVVKEFNS